MTQTESNACLEPGLGVNFVSASGATWDATVMRVHSHDRCDLNVYPGIYGASPVYQIHYDSDGEPYSWHKKSDVTNRVDVQV